MQNAESASTEERVILPVEMASMVPLRTLIGKMIRNSHAELDNLTETLPSMSDVERKRQILNYAVSSRKQFLKLYVLVKWAANANDIQMSQNIMAFLSNQNKVFQDTVEYFHKIYAELPAARVRNFDILTAVDVLTTGTYQRMPTKLQDVVPLPRLGDKEVLETFVQMNDVIRMHMLTQEVLPSPMTNYRIENGRIYFSIENEFEVSLTLVGTSKTWWVVSLDILVKSADNACAGDVDLSLNDMQFRLREKAQEQLKPLVDPNLCEPGTDLDAVRPMLYFPLVNLYDYLHLVCLNMQLEILFMQASTLKAARWINQLDVEMDVTGTKLVLIYWGTESPVARWGCPQPLEGGSPAHRIQSTKLEISIGNEAEKRQVDMTISVRDELQGLIQKAGIGASVRLTGADSSDKQAIFSALKYPKNRLDILWASDPDMHTTKDLLNPSELNVERLLQHVTACHGRSIIDKLRELLLSEHAFLKENGVFVVKRGSTEGIEGPDDSNESSELLVRYRHERFVSIGIESRTGHVCVSEKGRGNGDSDDALRELEDRLNRDPNNTAKYLVQFRSKVVIREIVSLAKQLNLQPYDHSRLMLRKGEQERLFEPVAASSSIGAPSITGQGVFQEISNTPSTAVAADIQGSVFLQFPQFEYWYLVFGISKNKFQLRLCNLKKVESERDKLVHELAHTVSINCDRMWKEPSDKGDCLDQNKENDPLVKKCLSENDPPKSAEDGSGTQVTSKRRRAFASVENMTQTLIPNRLEATDSLFMDLRRMAKLNSLCRGYITNKKVEMQLSQQSLEYRTRPLLKTLPSVEAQAVNSPAAGWMEAICVSQREILKACARVAAGRKTKEMMSWFDMILPRMRNQVVMRSSGLWTSGESECYVVIQDRLVWKDAQLQGDINDHISLDPSTGILSFAYTEIDTCVQQFLVDWERIFMMSNLARQMSSKWLARYKDNLEFEAFNLQALTLTYAKNYTCAIQWSPPREDQPSQYIIQLGTKAKAGKTKPKVTALPSSTTRNPHWRVAMFLQDQLNEKLDLIWLVQTLFQTLPLMVCLETLEFERTLNGTASPVSIIPRAVDSVRVLFPSSQALNIRFTNATTIAVLDASVPDTNQRNPSPQNRTGAPPTRENSQFRPFERFTDLIGTLEDWIFQQSSDATDTTRAISNLWGEPIEETAVAFNSGMLCSVTLCPELFFQLQI